MGPSSALGGVSSLAASAATSSSNAVMSKGTSSALLKLDPSIRDWVVLPMVAIMIAMGLCRHYAQQLLRSTQTLDPTEVSQKQTLMRSGRLRARGHSILPARAFYARRAYFADKDSGVFSRKVSKSGTNPMANPMSMVDNMKGQMLYMVPNMAMMGVISYFFHGFVLVKVPFPLTNRFKVMLQRGVDLAALDVSYVSSLSWYFLLMFGLRGVYKILLGEDSEALDEARATRVQMGMGMAGGGPSVFDAPGAFKREKEELHLTQHKWALDDVELKFLGPDRAARLRASAAAGNHPDAARASVLSAPRATAAGTSAATSAASSSSKKAPRVKKVRKKTKAT